MKLFEIFEASTFTPRDLARDDPGGARTKEYMQKKAEKHAALIKKDCQPWLSQTNNGRLVAYRGFGNETPELAFSKKVRKNRHPLDSDPGTHQLFNQIIANTGKVANRSNSVFVTSRKNLASTYSYTGEPHIILPVGNFNYTYSPKVNDWYHFAESMNEEDILEFFSKPGVILGDDGTLQKALKSSTEIMLSASRIYAFEPDYYKKYILPLLQK